MYNKFYIHFFPKPSNFILVFLVVTLNTFNINDNLEINILMS